MRRFIAIYFLIILTSFVNYTSAQHLSQLYVETRVGYEGENVDGEMMDNNTGFKGQWLNLRIDGKILDNLTYSYRQRLNKNTSSSFFDATDWIHLDWQATAHLALSAGKQVVGIGGYEYDRAPIDLYYCSEFWGNVPCYQWGVSAAYDITAKDRLLLQFCNSPFNGFVSNNIYSWNLMWYGQHKWWETMWSLNMLQYTENSWINYIALGNRFNIIKGIHLDLDLMNRAASNQVFLGKDCSIMSELSIAPNDAMRYFVKYTYDVNKSGTSSDYLVLDGTEISMASIGVEGSPIKNKREMLRLFGCAAYGWGTNSNNSGAWQDRQLLFEIGLKWRLDVLSSINYISKNK